MPACLPALVRTSPRVVETASARPRQWGQTVLETTILALLWPLITDVGRPGVRLLGSLDRYSTHVGIIDFRVETDVELLVDYAYGYGHIIRRMLPRLSG